MATALTLLLLALAQSQAADDAAYFDREVRPILVQRCFECHGAEGRPKGGLRLTTRAAFLAGGDSGPMQAGDGPFDASLVLEAIGYADELLQMPPAAKLPDAELAVLRAWIARGAPYGAAAPEASGSHVEADAPAPRITRGDGRTGWAYQPLASPPVPDVASAEAEVANPIDAFVLAKLTEAHLAPNPLADERTLVRRVYLDLLGLAPPPEVVEAYVQDSDPDKWSKLVERLLALPQYGERWGRHWLDVVRFAETNGFERDSDKPNIWRYRDWVVDAFNQDLPYDRFVLEQLAGDELPDKTHGSEIASGYLRLAQWDDEPGAGAVQGRYDVLDDIVSTTGQVFMGSTIGCARCHDHKADPFEAEHYYQFMAFFHGLTDMSLEGTQVDVSTPLEARIADEREAARKARIASLEARRGALIDELQGALRAESDGRAPEAAAPPAQDADVARWSYTTEQPAPDWAAVGFDASAWLSGEGGFGTRGTPGALVGTEWNSAHIWLRRTLAWDPAVDQDPCFVLHHDEDVSVYLNGVLALRREGYATKYLIDELSDAARAALRAGENTLAVECSQTAGGQYVDVALVARSATTRGRPLHEVARGSRPSSTGALNDEEVARLFEARGDELLGAGAHARFVALVDELRAAREERVPRARAFAAQESGATPAQLAIHVRGNANVLGKPVEPAIPAFLSAAALPQPQPTADGTSSGRRTALARWLIAPEHPLTARVMVNRIWQHHFGQGIVSTPNDFGELGERPTHPELLDWLAREFVARGWSVKAMHRLILASRTWRQSSVGREDALAVDATDSLLWRMAPRRLSAEEVRDGMLAVAGMLEPEMGGPSVFGRMPAAALATSSTPDKVWGESSLQQRNRRTLYVKVKRSLLTPFLVAHDMADVDASCPARFTTILPTQALQLVNGEFPHEVARHFAERLTAEVPEEPSGAAGGVVAGRVRRGLELALARPAHDGEVADYVAFLGQLQAEEALAPARALELFCLTVLNLNEFVFVD